VEREIATTDETNESAGLKNSAIAQYVKRVRRLPHVRSVAAEPEHGYIRVWTIISAPPFDFESRRPIYEVQQNVLQRTEEPLEFRLINLNELDGGVQDVPPAGSELLNSLAKS